MGELLLLLGSSIFPIFVAHATLFDVRKVSYHLRSIPNTDIYSGLIQALLEGTMTIRSYDQGLRVIGSLILCTSLRCLSLTFVGSALLRISFVLIIHLLCFLYKFSCKDRTWMVSATAFCHHLRRPLAHLQTLLHVVQQLLLDRRELAPFLGALDTLLFAFLYGCW